MRNIKLKLDGLTPSFLKEDGAQLVKFIEYYFEWLEENTDINAITTDFKNYQDVDIVPEKFLAFLADEFLQGLPDKLLVDKRRLIKNIRSFYLSKGTEKATKLLFRILFNEEVDFYYPKDDILRVSDGKWVVERSIKIFQGTGDEAVLQPTELVTTQSGAKARITRIDSLQEQGTSITEIFLSNITGTFTLGDNIYLGNTLVGEMTSNTLITYPGKYSGTDGFISSGKKIQDGYYYQEYSYEVISSRSKNTYEEAMNNLVHPAGMKLFGKVLLTESIDLRSLFSVDLAKVEHKDYEYLINVNDLVGLGSITLKRNILLDYQDLIHFTNITVSSTNLAGKISIFSDATLSHFVNVAMSNFIDVPFSLLGTKQMVYGNPLFANGTSFPTSFTGIFHPGSSFGITNTTFYTIQKIYNDDVMQLDSLYPAADFFNSTFFGKVSSNIIDATVTQLVSNNQIVLNFTANTYTYFNIDFPENFVFQNYPGTRHPLNVPTSNTFTIPIGNGSYNITYLYANANTFVTSANVSTASYNFANTAKNANVNSITFVKTP